MEVSTETPKKIYTDTDDARKTDSNNSGIPAKLIVMLIKNYNLIT